MFFYSENAGISSPCDTAPCLNGGTCTGDVTNWKYHCTCSENLSNENCQDGMYCNGLYINIIAS